MRGPLRGVWRAGAVVVGYAALVGWLTWPLATRLGTHLPDTAAGCRVDTLLAGWALSHQSRALATAPSTFPDAGIYHPTPDALFYGEPGFGAVPYFMPVFLVTGNPTLALNVTFLGCVVLTAAALHLLVRRWTGSDAAGLIAGGAFLGTRWVLWTWVPTLPSYAVLQYFPAIVFLAAVVDGRLPTAVLLLVLLILQGLTSPYVAAAAAGPVAVLAALRLLRAPTRRAGLTLIAIVALAATTWGLVNAPFVRIRVANPDLRVQTIWRDTGWHPTPLPWGPFSPDAATAVPTVVLAVIAAGLSAVAWARWRGRTVPFRAAWLHGLLWTVVGIGISLTPTVTWFGTPVRLPQSLLARWVPIFDLFRFPHRLAVAALMGLAILAGTAFAFGTRRLSAPARGVVAFGLLAATYLEYASGVRLPPVPSVSTLRASYPIWRAVTLEPALAPVLRHDRGPLLEIPVGPTLTGAPLMEALLPARSMYVSIAHGRPLVNGYHGYWPREFPERMALARRLPEPAALAALRCATGVEVILVRPGLFGAVEREMCRIFAGAGQPRSRCGEDFGAADRAAWLALAAEGGRPDLRLVQRGPDALVFAVGGPTECAGKVPAGEGATHGAWPPSSPQKKLSRSHSRLDSRAASRRSCCGWR